MEEIILNESNVIEVFKELSNRETISEDEKNQIKKRFKELVNHNFNGPKA